MPRCYIDISDGNCSHIDSEGVELAGAGYVRQPAGGGWRGAEMASRKGLRTAFEINALAKGSPSYVARMFPWLADRLVIRPTSSSIASSCASSHAVTTARTKFQRRCG